MEFILYSIVVWHYLAYFSVIRIILGLLVTNMLVLDRCERLGDFRVRDQTRADLEGLAQQIIQKILHLSFRILGGLGSDFIR